MLAVVAAFAVGIAVRLPTSFSFLLAAVVGFGFYHPIDLTVHFIAFQFRNTLDDGVLLALPMFALAGELNRIMGAETGLRRLTQSILAGNRLAPVLAPALASFLQGPLLLRSGCLLEREVALEARAMLLSMESEGVPRAHAWSALAASGGGALLVPPAFLAIVAGVVYAVSIVELMLALIVPVLLLLALSLLVAGAVCYSLPQVAPAPKLRRSRLYQVWRDYDGISFQLLAPAIVLTVLGAGLVTPSEVASLVATTAFVVAWLQPLRPRFKDLVVAFTRAAVVTVEWCFLIIGLGLFLSLANRSGWGQAVADYALDMPPSLVLLWFALVLPLLLSIVFGAASALILSAIFLGALAAQDASSNPPLVSAILVMLASVAGSLMRTIALPPKALAIELSLQRLMWTLAWTAPVLALWWMVARWPVLATGLPSWLFEM